MKTNWHIGWIILFALVIFVLFWYIKNAIIDSEIKKRETLVLDSLQLSESSTDSEFDSSVLNSLIRSDKNGGAVISKFYEGGLLIDFPDPDLSLDAGDYGPWDYFRDFEDATSIHILLDRVYRNDIHEVQDSARRFIDSLNFYIPEVSIPMLLNVFGKYFYRLSYGEIHGRLLFYWVNSEPALILNYDYLPMIPGVLEQLSKTNSRYPYDQIWDENYSFTMVNNTGSFSLDYGHIYPIPDYMYDIIYERVDLPRYRINVPNYEEILEKILQERNEDHRIRLLFLYLFLLNDNSAGSYLVNTTNALVYEVGRTKTLDNLTKATWVMGCAKFLATIDPYEFAGSIFPYFKQAEGLLVLDNRNKEYLKKLSVIRALWWNSLPGQHGKRSAGRIFIDHYSRYKDELSELEVYKLLTLAAHVNLSAALESFYNDQPIDYSVNIQIATYLIAASILANNFYTDYPVSEYSETNNLWTSCLEGYFFLNFRYDKAIETQKTCIELTLNEPHQDARFKLYNQIEKLNSLLMHSGDTNELKVWAGILYYDRDSISLEFSPFFDHRSCNPETYSTFREEFLSVNASEMISDITWATHKYRKLTGVKTVLKRAAKHEKDLGNWREAYLLLDKADSLTYHFNPEFFMNIQHGGDRSFYNVEKEGLQDSLADLRRDIQLLEGYQLELLQKNSELKDSNMGIANLNLRLTKKIEEKNTHIQSLDSLIEAKQKVITEQDRILADKEVTFAIVNSGLILIGLFALLAFWQRRRASLEARLNKYKSNVWQELGHIPGKSIDSLNDKLRSRRWLLDGSQFQIPIQELKPLEMLKGIINGLFDSVVKGDSERGNPFSAELKLVKDYLDYKNEISKANVQLIEPSETRFNLPPALLLSCVKNAIEHGELLDNPDAKIEIRVTKKLLYLELSLVNNGKPFESRYLNKKKLKKTSTGFLNMIDVMEYYNRKRWWIWNAVRWRNLNESYYTAATTFKIIS